MENGVRKFFMLLFVLFLSAAFAGAQQSTIDVLEENKEIIERRIKISRSADDCFKNFFGKQDPSFENCYEYFKEDQGVILFLKNEDVIFFKKGDEPRVFTAPLAPLGSISGGGYQNPGGVHYMPRDIFSTSGPIPGGVDSFIEKEGTE